MFEHVIKKKQFSPIAALKLFSFIYLAIILFTVS